MPSKASVSIGASEESVHDSDGYFPSEGPINIASGLLNRSLKLITGRITIVS